MIVTLSFDDGGVWDDPVLDVLDRLDIDATFYPTLSMYDRPFAPARMDKNTLKRRYARHEVGGHTLHHAALRMLPLDAQEIEVARASYEEWFGQLPVCFAYPSGQVFDGAGIILAKAGYQWARVAEASQKMSRWAQPVDVWLDRHDVPIRLTRPTHMAAHGHRLVAAKRVDWLETRLRQLLDDGTIFVTNAAYFEQHGSKAEE